jgi:multiple sugar transport system substrate-binding protein
LSSTVRKCSMILCAVLALVLVCGTIVSAETITFLTYGAWRVHPGWDRLFTAFEESTGISIELIYAPPQQIYDKVVATLAGGATNIDVLVLDSMWMPAFTSAGYLSPLPEDFLVRDEYLPVAIDAYSHDGNLYGAPLFAVAGFTFYRTDLFEAAGLDPDKPPTTWDELVEYGLKLTVDRDNDGIPEQYGYGFSGVPYACDFYEFLWQAGGDVLDADGNVIVNSEAGVEALRFLADLRNRYKIVPQGVVTYAPEDLRQMFASGQMAMMRNWPYVWATSQAEDSPIRGKVAMVPNPGHVLPTATTFGAWGLGIPTGSKKKDLAMKFLDFMSSYEGQKVLFVEGGEMPTRKAVYDDPDSLKAQPLAPVMLAALLEAKNRPMVVESREVMAACERAWEVAILGVKTPKEALDDAAREIERILAQ